MKVRIHEIAKELGIKSKDVVDRAKDLALDVKTASSAVSPEEAEQLVNFIMTGDAGSLAPSAPAAEAPVEKPAPHKQARVEKVEKVEKQPEPAVAEPVKKEEPTAGPEVSTTPKKVETEKKPEPKVEPAQATPSESKTETPKDTTKESLAQATVKKRRGLVIVKKKRDRDAKKAPEKPIEPTPVPKKAPAEILKPEISIQDLSEEEKAILDQKRKKKQKKHAPATSRKEQEHKIDILAERELNRSTVDEEDDEQEVMMIDLSDDAIKEKEEQEKKRSLDENRVRVQRKNPFMDQGIRRSGRRKKRPKKVEEKEVAVGAITIPEDVRVYEFADKLGKNVGEVIKVLFNLGVLVTKNDFLDNDALEILADEFEVDVEIKNPLEAIDYISAYDEDEDSDEVLQERPPVVTIMGHVDHGKTSLLDFIRSARVAEGEAGGITQHIGAYMVEKDGRKISFIDTPGHEAFTEMRARGAQVTDVAIIVVAADDGVQPQTKEALSHAKAADVPIVIAVNKVDKPEANPDLIMGQMAEIGYSPVDWGGEYEFVKISAKTGEGIEDLLETVLLQAEILELTANPDRHAKAVVVESSLEKGKGPVATVVVQNGTLKQGESIVVDTTHGRVRALIDDHGKQVKSIGPSEMAVLTGLNDVPPAGSVLVSVDSDAEAREYAEKRAEHVRQKELSKSTKVSFDELSALAAEGKLQNLPVIIKSDVQGSLAAIEGSLEKLKNEEVKINVVHSAVGGITESDITLAQASENTVILGFNVRPTGSVKEKAKALGIQIKTYSIIYDLIDDVKALLAGMMSPVIEEEDTGQAEVREVFTIPKVGAIAGCMVTDGTIDRNINVRVIRDGVVIYSSTINSLKRFKDDVKEVSKGYECGIMIDNFNDVKPGDVLETYKEIEKKREL